MVIDIEVLKAVVKILEEGKRAALCTIIEKKGSGPRDVGAKMAVSEDGKVVGTIGGGDLERFIVNEALKALKEGRPKKIVFSLGGEREGEKTIKTGLICGGEITMFIDVMEPKLRLILIGAGHVALPIAKIVETLGYRLTVIDDNDKLANRERFPMAEEIITGDFNQIIEKINIGFNDFVVITHGEPEHDYLALKMAIKKKPAYIGLLGSTTKVAIMIKRLKEMGISDEDLKVLHAPIGLDIGAQTPEEIAVSIVAEIIKEKRQQHIINC
jgi:xanthine dehydrogenase accessory factor